MSTTPILITGARGQLGLELQARAPGTANITAIDLQELDITDAAATAAQVAAIRPRWIINCAAYTAVDKAESDGELAMRVNRDGARHLALAAKQHGARLVQVSTDFVFDGRKSSPYLPDDAPHPLGHYGQTKLEGELAVEQASGGDALIVRTAWLYSAHGANFAKTILRLLAERPEVRVVADQVGTPTSAGTLADTLWKLIAADATGGRYHYTDSGVASWYDFAVAIRAAASRHQGRALPPILPIRTEDYPTPARRPAYSVLDRQRTLAITGPAPHWQEALESVMTQLLA